MAIALDGHAKSSTGTTSISASLTTAVASDVVIAIVMTKLAGNLFPGLQMSDAGNKVSNWKLQYEFPATNFSNGLGVQVWWGTTSSTMSANNITATFKDTLTAARMIVFAVSGANTTKPFDSNSTIYPGSLAHGSGFGAHATTNAFSTSCTNAMVVVLTGTTSNNAPLQAPSTGYTMIEATGNDANGDISCAQKVVSATQSSITLELSSNIGNGDEATMAFAIAAAGETACQNTPPIPMLEGTAQNGVASSGSSITATITTGNSGDVIIAAVARSANVAVSSVASTNTSGWTKYTTFNQGTDIYVDIWYGAASGLLTNETITATFASSVSTCAINVCGAVNSASPSPFDTNVSLPAVNGTSGGNMTTGSATSTNSAIMGLAVAGQAVAASAGSATSPAAPLIASSNGLHVNVTMFADFRGSAQSSTTYTLGSSSSGDWKAAAMALALPGAPSGPWASTETADTFAGAGRPGPYGTMAATEAKDIFAGTGAAGSALTGLWASTEATDLMAGVGHPALVAAWASTEAKDTFSFAGHDLALDGTAHNNSQTSSITTGTVTLTTAAPKDVVVLCIATKGGAVTGISDVAGLTWTKRTKFNPPTNSTEDMEIWWAYAPNVLTADVITVTFSTTNGYAIQAFALSGANTANPFDAHNANSVTTDNAGAGNPTRTITTDFTGSQFIFGFLGSDDGGGDVSAISTGMTTFVNKVGGAPYAALGYALKTTNQTNLSLSFAQNGGTFNDRYLMADAIVARVDVIGTLFTSDHKDAFAGAGYPQMRAAWASTEAKDVWSGTGVVPPFGPLAPTETKDTMAFVGDVGRPLGIDATAAAVAHDTTTCSVTITTTAPNDVIVLGILCGGFFNRSKVATITDTHGLVWKRRHTRSQIGVNPTQEIWWAKKTNTGATTITVTTFATTGFFCVDAIAISGARADTPWDTHSGAGYYNDNFGVNNPTGLIYSHAARCMGLAFYGSNDVGNTGVSVPWNYLDTLVSGENSGQIGRLDSAYQIFNSPQNGTPVSFGVVGGGANNRAIMQDVIVGNNDTVPNAATADVIRWFFDGHGNQNIVAMSGTANSLSQSVTTYNPDTTMLVAAMVQSRLGTRVLHVTDDGNHSGWTRRSIVTDTLGINSLELWWVQMADPFTGNVTVTLDSNVSPGDILGFIVLGINGPDLFLRGEIFDGHPSLPAVNHADVVSDPTVGPFSTLNENVLEIVISANQTQDQRGFEAHDWLQFVGNFFGSESGILVSHSPFFNIALEAKFSGPVVINDSTGLAISPNPSAWLMLADAMPVGPVSPPQGVWASTDSKDRTGNSGAFTAIGLDSSGWVGFPPNHAAMAAVETKDRTTNSGAFQAIWDTNGWIGYVPAFYSMAVIEAKDVSSLHAWVLGPTTILAQMETTEPADRFEFAGIHSQYTTADSTGDRTALITVTANASFAAGTPNALVNGLKANGPPASLQVNIAQASPMSFTFDFHTARVVQEARWYQNGPSGQPGSWVWRGSNDNATWTTISVPFNLDGGNLGVVIGDISANGTAYRYYQILQTTNAGGNDTPWLWEIEFKVEGIVGTMGAAELKDRFGGHALAIPTALPIPARKRRLLIVT